MRKYISLNSIFLFIIPIVTLLICLQIHVIYYELRSLPFIDGEASVSLIGRQEKTITIFKTGLFLYAIISRFRLLCPSFPLGVFFSSFTALLGFMQTRGRPFCRVTP